ncbi:hypothetical protein [Halorubrum gandharaense]
MFERSPGTPATAAEVDGDGADDVRADGQVGKFPTGLQAARSTR